ncbi:hypothetical protein J8281_17920 [Aquimarina sp. U1-2]|uniref:hypothetical protein n=1 Tax=Aquimarina sp. U1-2 TaxID=2823141 RepID=UPI001AECD403|nr:hypothetical protein [Aquimarina sp. U1-2]MBP2834079.1 hypothetical protein [Aquimarina sp. U1-2]
MDTLEKERIVRKNILQIFKENFNVNHTDDEILDINPEKESEASRSYYETIVDIFLLEPEHRDKITGKVKDTIKNVAELWTITLHYSIP